MQASMLHVVTQSDVVLGVLPKPCLVSAAQGEETPLLQHCKMPRKTFDPSSRREKRECHPGPSF